MEENLYDDLLVELECPICTNYMSPPIRQCATGHNVCENCRKKLPKCALCQGKFSDARNLSLEGIATKIRYPCINKNLGCNVKLSYTERETHELRCSLKSFKCAMEKCPWVGKLEELSNHWASKKTSSKPYSKSNICHTKMKAESFYVNMVSAYKKLFWFKCKLTNNKLYWAVQFIGNAAESENYYYEVEVFKPGRPKQKVLISNYCHSIELENSQLWNENLCSSISADCLNEFVTEDQLLLYYLRVSESKEGATGTQVPLPIQIGQAQAAPAKREAQPWKQRDRSKGPSAHKDKKRPFKPPQKKKEEFVIV